MTSPINKTPAASTAFQTFMANWDRLIEIIRADLEYLRYLNQEAAQKGGAMEGRMKAALRVTNFNNLLQLVLVVTIIETYLQDVLAECAAKRPSLMKGNQPSFPKVLAFDDVSEIDTVEDVRLEFCTRWSRGFISDGGPQRWIDRLARLGGKDLLDLDGQTLEELWGVRHVVVHAAGIVTRDFARRHSRLGVGIGSRIEVPGPQFSTYTSAALDFVAAVEKFVTAAFLSGPGQADEQSQA